MDNAKKKQVFMVYKLDMIMMPNKNLTIYHLIHDDWYLLSIIPMIPRDNVYPGSLDSHFQNLSTMFPRPVGFVALG